MKSRDACSKELQQHSDRLHAKKRDVASARASGHTAGETTLAAQTAAQAQTDVSAAEQQMKLSEQQVRFISTNLQKEVRKFDAERRRDLREVLIRNAQSQVEYARQARAFWEGLRDMHSA